MYPDPAPFPWLPPPPPPIAYDPPAYSSRPRPMDENPRAACGCICIINALFLSFLSLANLASYEREETLNEMLCLTHIIIMIKLQMINSMHCFNLPNKGKTMQSHVPNMQNKQRHSSMRDNSSLETAANPEPNIRHRI